MGHLAGVRQLVIGVEKPTLENFWSRILPGNSYSVSLGTFWKSGFGVCVCVCVCVCVLFS